MGELTDDREDLGFTHRTLATLLASSLLFAGGAFAQSDAPRDELADEGAEDDGESVEDAADDGESVEDAADDGDLSERDGDAITDAGGNAAAIRPKKGAAASEKSVGIVVAAMVNIRDNIASEFAKELAVVLTEKLLVQATSGDASTASRTAEIAADCMVRPECIQDVGHAFATDELLFISVARVGQEFVLDFTWADVSTGTAQARPRIFIASDATSKDKFVEFAEKLLPGVPIRPEPEPEAAKDTKPTVFYQVTPPTPRHMTSGAWGATAVGSAALIGAMITGLLAQNAYNELEDGNCKEVFCEDLQDERDLLRAASITTDVLIGVGVAAGATAAVLYFFSSKEGSRTPVEVGSGPGDVGVSLVLGF